MKKKIYIINLILCLLAITVIIFTILVASGKVLTSKAKTEAEWTAIEVEDISNIEITSDAEFEKSENGSTATIEEEMLDFNKDEAMSSGEIIHEESYTITRITEERDREFVQKNKIDLSGKKITVLGDSLTVGYPEEEIKGDNFPNALKEIFNCEVVNLGVTGSMISHFYDRAPMYERWREIDKDSDIIIVYAGTNDMMIVKKDEFGDISTPDTFCYELETMLSGIAKEYPDAIRIVVNPCVTGHVSAVCGMDPDNYYEQEPYADIIIGRAEANGYIVVDLYYTNLLNSCNQQILADFYLADCLHMNPNGYHFLGNHVAVEIINAIKKE